MTRTAETQVSGLLQNLGSHIQTALASTPDRHCKPDASDQQPAEKHRRMATFLSPDVVSISSRLHCKQAWDPASHQGCWVAQHGRSLTWRTQARCALPSLNNTKRGVMRKALTLQRRWISDLTENLRRRSSLLQCNCIDMQSATRRGRDQAARDGHNEGEHILHCSHAQVASANSGIDASGSALEASVSSTLPTCRADNTDAPPEMAGDSQVATCHVCASQGACAAAAMAGKDAVLYAGLLGGSRVAWKQLQLDVHAHLPTFSASHAPDAADDEHPSQELQAALQQTGQADQIITARLAAMAPAAGELASRTESMAAQPGNAKLGTQAALPGECHVEPLAATGKCSQAAAHMKSEVSAVVDQPMAICMVPDAAAAICASVQLHAGASGGSSRSAAEDASSSDAVQALLVWISSPLQWSLATPCSATRMAKRARGCQTSAPRQSDIAYSEQGSEPMPPLCALLLQRGCMQAPSAVAIAATPAGVRWSARSRLTIVLHAASCALKVRQFAAYSACSTKSGHFSRLMSCKRRAGDLVCGCICGAELRLWHVAHSHGSAPLRAVLLADGCAVDGAHQAFEFVLALTSADK